LTRIQDPISDANCKKLVGLSGKKFSKQMFRVYSGSITDSIKQFTELFKNQNTINKMIRF